MKHQNFCFANRRFMLPAIALIFLMACQKNINDKAVMSNEALNVSSESSIIRSGCGVVATDWYKLQLRFLLYGSPPPTPNSGRSFAYTGIALYEAVQNGIPDAVSLHRRVYEMPVMPKPEKNKVYAWDIAANAALADITRNLYTGLTDANKASVDSLENAYFEKLLHNPQVAERSKAFGKAIAAAVFEWSKSDLFDHANDPYTPPVFDGAWVPTPLLFLPAAAPYVGNCRTFLAIHKELITPPPPYTYSENANSDFYKMVNEVYKASKSLTQEQKDLALFWNDLGVGIGYTPQGHQMSIVMQALENEKASLSTAAQGYVKAGMAQWDANVVTWRSKYEYNLLRPVTYIRKLFDTSWLPYINTPNHPEYPAAHAFVTAATMEAIASVLGDNYAFTDHTYDFLGYNPRSYNSFQEAAIDAGVSRFYGGIHYRPSIKSGNKYGVYVGNNIAAIQLIK